MGTPAFFRLTALSYFVMTAFYRLFCMRWQNITAWYGSRTANGTWRLRKRAWAMDGVATVTVGGGAGDGNTDNRPT